MRSAPDSHATNPVMPTPSHQSVIEAWTKGSRRVQALRGSSINFAGSVIYSGNTPLGRKMSTGEYLLSTNAWAVYRGWRCVDCGQWFYKPSTRQHLKKVIRWVRGGVHHKRIANGWSPYHPTAYKHYFSFTPEKRPSNADIVLYAALAERQLREYCWRRGGWEAQRRLMLARTMQARARALAERFKLDWEPVSKLAELWQRAERHESVCIFGGVTKLRTLCQQYQLPRSTSVDKLTTMLTYETELQRQIFAAQIRENK